MCASKGGPTHFCVCHSLSCVGVIVRLGFIRKKEEELVFSVARVNTFRTPLVPFDPPPVSLLTPNDPLHPTLFRVPSF